MPNLANFRVKLKFNNSVLVQKSLCSLQSNFILNIYIVYLLKTWPRHPTNNFALKSCLFGTVKLTRNADKTNFIYNTQGIAFVGARL